MKKIFVFLFALCTLSIQAQDFPTKVDTTYGDYSYEYLYGRIPSAERKAYNLLRVNTAWTNLIGSMLTNNSTVRAAALADLNGLLGVSYSAPSLVLNDSLFLYYAIDAEGDEQWVGLSTNGALFGDSLVTSGYGLTDELEPISKYLNNLKDGELYWRYKKDGIIVEKREISGRPSEGIQQLQWGIEHSFRYSLSLQRQIWILYAVVVLLGIGLGASVWYNIKK